MFSVEIEAQPEQEAEKLTHLVITTLHTFLLEI